MDETDTDQIVKALQAGSFAYFFFVDFIFIFFFYIHIYII